MEHKDVLGKILNVGDHVVFPHRNQLLVGKITKLNKKMVKVIEVPYNSGWPDDYAYNKYSHDTCYVEGSAVTFYLLKNSK